MMMMMMVVVIYYPMILGPRDRESTYPSLTPKSSNPAAITAKQ